MKKPILITLCCVCLMLVTPLTSVAQENTVSSNLPEQQYVDDDCDICPSNKWIKSIEDKKETKKLTNIIDEHLIGDNKLKQDRIFWNFPITCITLYIIFIQMYIRAIYANWILWMLIPYYSFLYTLFERYLYLKNFQIFFILKIANTLNCLWDRFYYV